MNIVEIEEWAARILQLATSRGGVEDTRVELKATLPDAAKAARRLAGHANAAGGASILWLIGVGNDGKIVSGSPPDQAAWLSQVKSCFCDGASPDVQSIHIGKVLALCFDTRRAPFVVRNPEFGKPSGGAIEYEVPWRDGTAIRSASRSDLLRILLPARDLPTFELLKGGLVLVREDTNIGPRLRWSLFLALYAHTLSESRVTFPFHRCQVTVNFGSRFMDLEMGDLKIEPQTIDSANPRRDPSRVLSATIDATPHEVHITGPGWLQLRASAQTPIEVIEQGPLRFT